MSAKSFHLTNPKRAENARIQLTTLGEKHFKTLIFLQNWEKLEIKQILN